MTIAEQLKEEVEALPAKDQRALLTIARSLRNQSTAKQLKGVPKSAPRKTLGQARAALRAIKGMWKDRTDLPADTVEASIEIRRRVMRRGAHG